MTLDELQASGRATITAPELGDLLGVGRNAAYGALESGEVPGRLKIGRRVLVAVPALLAWLGAEPERESTPAVAAAEAEDPSPAEGVERGRSYTSPA